MAVECPSCEKNMRTTEYEGVRIESCLVCGGHWLDHDELKKITDIRERKFNALERKAVAAAASYQPAAAPTREDRDLLCPKCGSRTDPLNYGGSDSLVIDKCTGCGGFWLDPGELDQVQKLVEGWDDLLSDDLQQYSDRLHDISLASDALDPTDDLEFSRLPLVAGFLNACVNGILELTD